MPTCLGESRALGRSWAGNVTLVRGEGESVSTCEALITSFCGVALWRVAGCVDFDSTRPSLFVTHFSDRIFLVVQTRRGANALSDTSIIFPIQSYESGYLLRSASPTCRFLVISPSASRRAVPLGWSVCRSPTHRISARWLAWILDFHIDSRRSRFAAISEGGASAPYELLWCISCRRTHQCVT